MLEMFFSLLMILVPITALLFKKFIPLFLILVIGANPYVSAGSLLFALIIRFQDIFKYKIKNLIFILSSIWLGYGLIIGLKYFSLTFLSEYIQLVIAILLLIYLYHSINTKKQLLNIFKYMMYSGIILAFFEIIIFLIDQDINTSSLVGRVADNYCSFYLVISTIILPLYFMKENKIWIFDILFGFYAVYINESRAMMLLSILFLVKQFISFNSIYFKILMSTIMLVVINYIYITFDASLIYDPNSIYSVLNFENNFSNLERLNLLFFSYDLFINNPFGYGLGSSYDLFTNNPLTVNDFYPHPHNTFAFLAVEQGLIGILIYFYFFYSLFKSVNNIYDLKIKKLVFNIALALFLYSLVDVLFYNGILMLIIFMLYGTVLASSKVGKKC